MSISAAISIYNLAPIFVLIMGTLFLRERINIQSVLAVVICFLGSLFVVGLEQFHSVDNFLNSGFIWAILSALCYAMTMFIGKGIQGLSAYATTFLQTTVGIVMLAPIVPMSEFSGLTTSNWLYILGTGFIHTGFVCCNSALLPDRYDVRRQDDHPNDLNSERQTKPSVFFDLDQNVKIV